MKPILILAALALFACGRIPGGEKEKYTATDPETVAAVLDAVLSRLDTEYEEHGPQFVKRVPQLKQEVVVAHGFEDWREFSERVRGIDPAKDLWLSRQITMRMEKLLELPYEPSDEREPEEDEE